MRRGLIVLLALLFIASCSLENSEQEDKSMFELEIPEGFDFSMEQEVELSISLYSGFQSGVEGITFSVYYPTDGNESTTDLENLNFIQKFTTNQLGLIEHNIKLPSYVDNLVVSGFMQTLQLEIINGRAEYEFMSTSDRSEGEYFAPVATRGFSYLEGVSYNNQGVPNPMNQVEISAELLQRIDTSLPEREDLAITHPQYLQDNVVTNLVIEDSSDVWITFITEGAGLYNSLGFYTYNAEAGPPASSDELEHVIVFPNASLYNSGGGLYPGDQVYLGSFGAGTVMGWFLIANGWINIDEVDTTNVIYYSNPEYNPEGEEYNQHQVFLYDNAEELFLMGFEDLQRPWGDNDFNDAVFFITANPIENINLENVLPIDEPVDTDNDGVNDPYDEYPEDPQRAYRSYYPSRENTATLVFEDKWPSYGDYDMNDMVLDYQYLLVTNAENELKDLKLGFSLRASGAFYNNGFSVQLPIASSNLENNSWSSNILPELVSDGDKTILDLFTGTTALTGLSSGEYFNTDESEPFYAAVAFWDSLSLINALAYEALDMGYPFNPFMRKSGHNEHEIHIMNYPPTGRHDQSLFNQDDDNSSVLEERYFVSPLNLPWALNLPESWHYPIEKVSITEAYKNFATWAESGGIQHQEWYLYNEENVDAEKLYQQR